MKKILSLLLAMIMVFSLATVTFAEKADQDAKYKKIYNAENTGTTSPAETFTFTYTPKNVTDADGSVLKNGEGKEITIADMPAIKDSTVSYKTGDAGKNAEQEITVALSEVKWPYVGIYTYTVKETAGNTAGVTYDVVERTLKVTVAYDEGTDTYYTAFVSLNLVDADQDGITDGSKTDSFVNEYSAGTLAINKQVTGNLGDKDMEFDVKVIFTAPEGEVVMSDIKYSDVNKAGTVDGLIEAGKEGWTGSKEVKIKLKHDETITFTNIPYGVTYKIEEDSYKDVGYDPAHYAHKFNIGGVTIIAGAEDTINIGGESKPASEYIDMTVNTASEYCQITNNKETTVDTGISLDSAPYFLMLAVALFGMVALVSKKRYEV